MLRWFVFAVGFGLLPFAFSVLIVALETGSLLPLRRSPELLFFAVMICGAQLGASFTEPSAWLRSTRPGVSAWASGMFLLGGILASGLYGMYVDRERNLAPACREVQQWQVDRSAAVPPVAQSGNLDGCPEDVIFLENVFVFSVWLAAWLGATATATEWLRTRRFRWRSTKRSSFFWPR
ncbi:MAG TPA: hypothetical protein VF665_15040 [Longimicrobium sp.]|jgi:hypothetical protein|uniref:hypothetical protein n=1 Tax=Longimicrobium sp. TaxID=2029185 RepID=UPI002ED85162